MEVPTLRDESCSSSPSASLSVPPSLPGASSSVPPASHASQETNDDMEEDQPMQPLKFFFSQTEYGKTCKISTRCDIVNTRETIDSLQLSVSGKRWFRRHPQFKHIWHMDRDRVCKVMGFWMLFLRTASTEKSRVCWFVVNGVPIRYSMREHALISGLNCHEYPPRYKQLGSFSFVKRIFGRAKKISIKDVEKKLKDMEDEDTCQDDLLKLAVLYFLAKVIRGKKKIIKGSIDRFILRIVDDLDACKTFPWGRLTFEDNMKAIFHMIGHFNGKVKSSWGFPGFIVPLEVLAFECIPNLGKKFYEVVSGANDGCPRMCKHRLKATGMKGFPLEDIYEALGKTKDILSILEPSCAEQDLLLRIMERDEDGRDSIDPIADCWNERLDLQQKKIWWENLYKLDIASREENVSPAEQSNQQERSFPPAEQMSQQEGNVPSAEHMEDGFKEFENRMLKAMDNGFKKIKEQFDGMDKRLKDVESFVNVARSYVYERREWYMEEGFEMGEGACGGDMAGGDGDMAAGGDMAGGDGDMASGDEGAGGGDMAGGDGDMAGGDEGAARDMVVGNEGDGGDMAVGDEEIVDLAIVVYDQHGGGTYDQPGGGDMAAGTYDQPSPKRPRKRVLEKHATEKTRVMKRATCPSKYMVSPYTVGKKN